MTWPSLLLGSALGASVAACGHLPPTSSLPPPPVISAEAERAEFWCLAPAELLATTPPTLEGLDGLDPFDPCKPVRLWLDEIERYFEGVECWLEVSDFNCERGADGAD